MSLDANLVMPINSTTYTFDEITRDATSVIRSDNSRPLSAPRTLTIKHTMAPANAKGPKIDRHLISFSDTVVVNSIPSTATVNLTLTVPRDFPIDESERTPYDVVGVLMWLLSSSAAQLLRGES